MLFALAATAAAAQQRMAYTVTGEVNDSTAEGRMIYIMRYDDNKYIDSTRIKGGKFVFRGTVVSPCYCYIRATDRDHANFILEGGDVRVSMGEGAYDKPSGTPLNDEMRRISLMVDSIFDYIGLETARIKAQHADEAGAGRAMANFQDSVLADVSRMSRGLFALHRDDAVAEYLLYSNFFDALGLDGRERTLASLGPQLQELRLVRELAARLRAERLTSRGQMFADISGCGLDGKPVKLSDYVGRGGYVLADFWASWCRPCREETPNLARLHREFGGRGLTVVGIFVEDSEANMAAAVRKEGIGWPQIFDTGGTAMERYGLNGIPMIILFGPDGRIVERGLRGKYMIKRVTEIMDK